MSRLAEHLNRAWLHRSLLACTLWPISLLMSVLVRLRRDGSLHKYIEIPASYRSAIVARTRSGCAHSR